MNNQVSNFRNKINNLEANLEKSPNRVDIKTEHFFAQGVYARKITIKAGCTLTGKIHKYDCINTLLKGEITVSTEEGNKTLKAPAIFISPAGTKRAGYTHSETIWVTFHHTKSTDPDKVEDEVIAKNFLEYDKLKLK